MTWGIRSPVTMDPGEHVVLPDGRTGYFQQRLPDGSVVVLVYATIPAAEAKKVKKVAGGR